MDLQATPGFMWNKQDAYDAYDTAIAHPEQYRNVQYWMGTMMWLPVVRHDPETENNAGN